MPTKRGHFVDVTVLTSPFDILSSSRYNSTVIELMQVFDHLLQRHVDGKVTPVLRGVARRATRGRCPISQPMRRRPSPCARQQRTATKRAFNQPRIPSSPACASGDALARPAPPRLAGPGRAHSATTPPGNRHARLLHWTRRALPDRPKERGLSPQSASLTTQ